MVANKKSTGRSTVKDLAPPTDEELQIKDKWFLLLEVVWLTIQILPHIFMDIFRRLFQQPKSLRGQVALVTGAARGLGKGLALALAEEGCKVAVADVNVAGAEDTAEEIRQNGGYAMAYCCNVAKVEEVKKLRVAITQDLGPVDLLVNNAGLIFSGALEDCSEEEISGVISVNLLSHFWMVKEFLPAMKGRNFGHIVAISSITAYLGGADGTAYVASKCGVNGFMECVRAELKRIPNNNIKTTTVCPYFINTSADYVDQWDLRLPAMSIKEVVEATIESIKVNKVIFTLPGHAHYSLSLLRFLPQSLHDKVSKTFYSNMIPPSKQEKTPTTDIIEDLAGNKCI